MTYYEFKLAQLNNVRREADEAEKKKEQLKSKFEADTKDLLISIQWFGEVEQKEHGKIMRALQDPKSEENMKSIEKHKAWVELLRVSIDVVVAQYDSLRDEYDAEVAIITDFLLAYSRLEDDLHIEVFALLQ